MAATAATILPPVAVAAARAAATRAAAMVAESVAAAALVVRGGQCFRIHRWRKLHSRSQCVAAIRLLTSHAALVHHILTRIVLPHTGRFCWLGRDLAGVIIISQLGERCPSCRLRPLRSLLCVYPFAGDDV